MNYLLKVKDAKMGEIKKALESAGITVKSIVEIYKEDISKDEQTKN